MTGSKINPSLTIDYLTTEHENKYFDRKSAKIASKDLPPLITAFANAEGGTVVIGISDKMQIEGINSVGEDKINDFINAPSLCRPMPDCECEYLDVTNCNGIPDRLLLIHVKPKFPVVFGNYSLKGVASDYSFFLIISAFFEHYLFQF